MKTVTWMMGSVIAGLGVMLASACSSNAPAGGDDGRGDPDAGQGPDTAGSTPPLQVNPPEVYSGFDNENVFRIPIAVYGAGNDLTVSVSDPSVVSYEPVKLKDRPDDQGKWFMLTAKKVGQTSFRATSGGKTEQSSINVISYARGRYAAGQTRYTTADGDNPACTQCHGGQAGIDHSPAAIASASDQQVAAVITSGRSISGSPIDAEKRHRWNPTETALDGLVTYLRALPPRGFE